MLGYRRALLPALLALAAFGAVATHRAYVHDDVWIVGSNPVLSAGSWLETARVGYWESARGAAAEVHEWRPLLLWSFRAPAGRALNVLLHALCSALVFLFLRRRLAETAALAGACAFAVLPVHVEAVAALTGRSELLAAALLLGAWLALDARRVAAGAALFWAALYVKEHALLFPLFLALSDWTFSGELPWSKKRRGVHAALLAGIAVYLALRLGWARVGFGGGVPYFADRLTAALTVSRFAVTRYLWPSLTGAALCPDFARPLIPDAPPSSPLSWPPLLALAAAYGAGAAALLKRKPWAFWLLGPSVFLLPTIHVLAPLDSIGGQRFLYLPSLGLAAALGAAYDRARPRAALLLLAFWGWRCASYAEIWRTGPGYYAAVAACNPVSARARAAWGAELIAAGRVAEGERELDEASRLDPAMALPWYNRARLAWARGDAKGAAALTARSLALDAGESDAWTLAGLAAGDSAPAEADFRKALELKPWNAAAHYNLARRLMGTGRAAEAAAHFEAFARWAPGDPDAPAAAALASRLRGGR